MENNKLIAEFMGWEVQYQLTNRWYGAYREPNGKLHRNTDTEPLLFHASWDWLMPVIHTIRDHVNTDMGFEEFDDWRENFKQIDPYNYNLEQCYDAVVEFIKWYNKCVCESKYCRACDDDACDMLYRVDNNQ